MPDIKLKSFDAAEFDAYLAQPQGGKGAALVVIQEIFGVNRVMRELCDGFVRQGYFALCPDLFWRQEPGVQLSDQTQAEWDKAFKLMNGFDFQKGVADLSATLAHARKLKGATGKAGNVGYCMGGSLAYMMSCFTDTDASVGYYPVQIDQHLEHAKNIKKPLMLHIAEKDKFCPPEAQKKIKDALSRLPGITLHSYAGVDHAFAREGGQNYNAQAAKQANQRTAEFFKAHLR